MTPLNKKKHLNFYFQPTSTYKFAGSDTICPILVSEVASVINISPLAFIKNESTGKLGFFQMLSHGPPKNSFVNDKGKWVAEYLPAYYRVYPFNLVTTDKTENPILCFDETSGLLSADQSEFSIPLFEKEGVPTKQFSLIIQEIQRIHAERKRSQRLINEITELDIFEEWKIRIKTKDVRKDLENKDLDIKGLWKISNKKLKEVNKEQLHNLLRTGALDIIYAHWFSLKNLPKLFASDIQSKINNKTIEESLYDRAVSKQKATSEKELNTLVQNLLLDD